MVMSPKQQRDREVLEGLADTDELEEVPEEVEKAPTHWTKCTPVRIHGVPLSPELFDGIVEYRSNGTKKNPEGLVTILDEDFLRYRIGGILSPIEEKIRAISDEGELESFVFGAISYYYAFLEERDARMREQRKEEILEKATKKYDRLRPILIAANPAMKGWTKDKFIQWISENMEL